MLGQVAVDDKTNEIGAILSLLRVLQGKVFTIGALLMQRLVAQGYLSADPRRACERLDMQVA